jgi:RNA polymerase sigma factor (sigma-70 family)
MMHPSVPAEEFDTPVETVDRLYRRFGEELRVFFKRKSRRNSPEDLMHLVFLRLLNCRGLSEVRDPRLYLYKIAWNVLYTENRRQKYEPPRPVSTDPEQSEEARTAHSRLWDEGSFENVEDLADLEGALHAFRPEQQTVFLLYWSEGYTCEEVSGRTNINIHTVRKYVGQVMFQLRKSYGTNASHDK